VSRLALQLVALQGLGLVQDGGRPGRMHQGVPCGGPAVPELLGLSNRALGNRWDAPAIELWGSASVRLVGAPGFLSVDGELTRLEPGGTANIASAPGRRLRYLAVPGGLSVPCVLGGRGTLLVAGLGGHQGRPLRPGDVLPIGSPGAIPERSSPPLQASDGPIRVVAGPDLPDALGELVSHTFRISSVSDRVGTRLRGPRLQATGSQVLSTPMVRGAIQLPPGGEPVVLGPDHPTTGGYPVLAVVIRADWGRLGLRAPGAAVTFEAVSLAAARSAWAQVKSLFEAG
jgi:5-oxoprolinase (ATP-hydrolysing) subunit C